MVYPHSITIYATIQHSVFSNRCSSLSLLRHKAQCFKLTLYFTVAQYVYILRKRIFCVNHFSLNFFILSCRFDHYKNFILFRRLHLQSLNQKCKKHVTFLYQINFLESHLTHSRNRLVTNDLFNSHLPI